jgi:hypothetical protein
VYTQQAEGKSRVALPGAPERVGICHASADGTSDLPLSSTVTLGGQETRQPKVIVSGAVVKLRQRGIAV